MKTLSYKQWKNSLVLSAMEKKIPIVGHYELTACCNLDCKMCFIHNADTNALRARELSTETWKRIFDEAYESGLMFAVLSGGECMVRPDFKELYLHLWNKGVKITILTNGTLITDDYIRFFEKYRPDHIRISLYGCSEEGYLRVTGHKGFEKVISTIRKLMSKKIPVRLITTASSYMKDDYINILRLCKENNFPINPGGLFLLQNREHPEKDDHYLSIDEIVALSKARYELLKGIPTPIECAPEPCGNCDIAPQGLKCSAGASTAVVSWDGRMYPCVMLPHGDISVLEMSYAEAWEKTKESVQQMLLGMECVGCAYDQVCPQCPATRLTGLHTGHCNPDVCEATRRLVVAGVKTLGSKEEECND